MLTWPSSADAPLLIDVLDSGTTFLYKILVKTTNEKKKKKNSFEI